MSGVSGADGNRGGQQAARLPAEDKADNLNQGGAVKTPAANTPEKDEKGPNWKGLVDDAKHLANQQVDKQFENGQKVEKSFNILGYVTLQGGVNGRRIPRTHDLVAGDDIRSQFAETHMFLLGEGKAKFGVKGAANLGVPLVSIFGGGAVEWDINAIVRRDLPPENLKDKALEIPKVILQQIEAMKLAIPQTAEALLMNDKDWPAGTSISLRKAESGNVGVSIGKSMLNSVVSAGASIAGQVSASDDRTKVIKMCGDGIVRIRCMQGNRKGASLSGGASAGLNIGGLKDRFDDWTDLEGTKAEPVADKGSGAVLRLLSRQGRLTAGLEKSHAELEDIEVELDLKNPKDREIYNRFFAETDFDETLKMLHAYSKTRYVAQKEESNTFKRNSDFTGAITNRLFGPVHNHERIETGRAGSIETGNSTTTYSEGTFTDTLSGWFRTVFQLPNQKTTGRYITGKVTTRELPEGSGFEALEMMHELSIPKFLPEHHELMKRFAGQMDVPNYPQQALNIAEHGITSAEIKTTTQLGAPEFGRLRSASFADFLVAGADESRALQVSQLTPFSKWAPWVDDKAIGPLPRLKQRIRELDAIGVPNIERAELVAKAAALEQRVQKAADTFEKTAIKDFTLLDKMGSAVGVTPKADRYTEAQRTALRDMDKDVAVFLALKAIYSNLHQAGDVDAKKVAIKCFDMLNDLPPDVQTIVVATIRKVSGAPGAAHFEATGDAGPDKDNKGFTVKNYIEVKHSSPDAINVPTAQSLRSAAAKEAFKK